MTDLLMGDYPNINLSTLDAELRAALPAAFAGLTHRLGVLTVHVTDNVPGESVRPTVSAVLAAHNPAVLTAEQQLEQRRALARVDLEAADFVAVRTAIQNASTLAALRPILLALLRLVYRLALAQGMTRAADPEA